MVFDMVLLGTRGVPQPKELTNADIRSCSGERYMALVPELFELSLAAGEDEKNSP
jgi:hypothetical protein